MRTSGNQSGFILMIVVMVLLIVAVAGFAFFRVQHRGVALPHNPLSVGDSYRQTP